MFVVGIYSVSSARADHAPMGHCMVDVRSLRGSEPAEENVAKQLEAGEFLADLRDQLQSLPYSHFDALSHERQKVPLHEKGVFRVLGANGDQNTVFVEIECIGHDGARIQIDWKDVEGSSLLSRQLSLVNGKNLVVGTDHADKVCPLMSVKVECSDGSAKQ